VAALVELAAPLAAAVGTPRTFLQTPLRGRGAIGYGPRPTQPSADGSKRTTTDLEVGVLLTSAVESNGTSTLVSG
jgi:hypothetical protein